MESLNEFIKPELLVLVPVLYIVGMGLKNTKKIADEFIPIIVGCCGILLSCMYVIGEHGISVPGMFTSITQGILCAGATVYVNQIVKQANKR
jgi:hypothetical protein